MIGTNYTDEHVATGEARSALLCICLHALVTQLLVG